MSWLIKFLDKIFSHRVIVNCEREPYLHRWYLFRRKRIALFLHFFHRSDEDRALHDHPWSFITIILWRGYNEFTSCKCDGRGGECPSAISRRIYPGMICFRPAEHRHRVELVNGKPAWTLVIRFKERRDWGFWEKTGFVQWNKWWQNNCE